MKIPTEKQSFSNPKLANPWEGPYRVIEVSDNSALVTLINVDRDSVRVPFDSLKKLPPGITDEPLDITPYGLALAMNAHRRRCHEYAKAVQNAKGKRFDHSPAFPQGVL
ncbi:unnamed protein product, partial [Heligmosomoides polygyrus]|uniref:Inorganic diphosphatase n=1 Tax=Heligmosomoides polygyrus TaxID=6339 RepID=A0A183FA67_HELPZ